MCTAKKKYVYNDRTSYQKRLPVQADLRSTILIFWKILSNLRTVPTYTKYNQIYSMKPFVTQKNVLIGGWKISGTENFEPALHCFGTVVHRTLDKKWKCRVRQIKRVKKSLIREGTSFTLDRTSPYVQFTLLYCPLV